MSVETERRHGAAQFPARAAATRADRGSGIATLLLLALLLGVAGCATTPGAGPPLADLRGAGVLVVDVRPGEDPAGEEARVGRELSVGPLRAWPSEVVPPLGPEREGTRLDAARGAAIELRRPWLLVLGGSEVRVEAARDQAVRWRRSAGSGEDGIEALGVAAGLREPRPGLLPERELSPIRQAFVGGEHVAWRAAVEAASAAFPGDPALQVHAALAEGRSMAVAAPGGGEHELLALVLQARLGGHLDLAARLLDILVAAAPGRPDLWAQQVELRGEWQGPEAAFDLALARLAEVRELTAGAGTGPDELPWRWAELDLQEQLGWQAKGSGRRERAAQAFGACAEAAQRLAQDRDEARCRHELGVLHGEDGRPRLAVVELKEALRLRERGGDWQGAARSREDLARALLLVGRPADARRELEGLATAASERGDIAMAWVLLRDTLEALGQEGKPEGVRARGTQLRADLARLPEESRTRAEADLDWEEGSALGVAGDDRGALGALERALLSYRAMGLRLEEGQTLYAMASPALDLGDLRRSIDLLQRALAIAEELDDVESVAVIREQLAAMGAPADGGEPP